MTSSAGLFYPQYGGESLLWRWGWARATGVFEKAHNSVMKAGLSEMEEEDVDISAVGNRPAIKWERKAECEVKQDDYYYCEHSYGRFSCSMDVHSKVYTEKIEANYEDSVLEISLPRTPEVKPNKISVSAKKRAKASK